MNLELFILAFLFASLTPGLCMILALSLGIRFGLRRTFFMMIGELAGVVVITIVVGVGMGNLILIYPKIFTIFKVLGGLYLVYVGIKMWRAVPNLNFSEDALHPKQLKSKSGLAAQGFITAIVNPKGWAFFLVLLPPFIDYNEKLTPQLIQMGAIILMIESFSLFVYASGGNLLKNFLSRGDNIEKLDKISGSLMILVGIWLVFS